MLNFTKRTDELVSRVSLYAEQFQHLSIGLSSLKFCFNQIDRFRTKFGMTNLNKRFAFTLSELLLSLIIVGVVAIITVPVLINNVQKKLFATQVKNFVAQIEQLAQDELITHRTRDLSNTDFANPELFLSDKYFDIIKKCSDQTALSDCWKTSDAIGKNKVIYRKLNNTIYRPASNSTTIILKNGMILTYYYNEDARRVGYFHIDVNGNSKPNIWGRDVFLTLINHKGKMITYSEWRNSDFANINSCKTLGHCCYDLLIKNNWKMDY